MKARTYLHTCAAMLAKQTTFKLLIQRPSAQLAQHGQTNAATTHFLICNNTQWSGGYAVQLLVKVPPATERLSSVLNIDRSLAVA